MVIPKRATTSHVSNMQEQLHFTKKNNNSFGAGL
jgi:hypothetical protein